MKKLALIGFMSALALSGCGGGNEVADATSPATEIENSGTPGTPNVGLIGDTSDGTGPGISTETEAPPTAPDSVTKPKTRPTVPADETGAEAPPAVPDGQSGPEAPSSVPATETEAPSAIPEDTTESEPESAPDPDPEPEPEATATDPSVCNIHMQDGARVPCFSNYSLNKTTYKVTRAVIMIHGTDRNAKDYFGTALSAAELAGKAGETIVIAPHFKSTDDTAKADELQWSSSGWKIGNKSVDKAGLTRASSFAVMDRLIEVLADRSVFPSLTDIVVTGHSAGGQFTQRYAAGTKVDIGKTSYRFKYVVANPSSYMYLNEYRPYTVDSSHFTVPQTSCSYDDYKYGLKDKNAYMSLPTNTQLIANYNARQVVYLLGTKDVNVDSNLDTGCAANLQGPNRYERGRNYMNYMNYFYSINNHARVDVPGVGHTRSGMYKSSTGLNVLFN